MSHLEKLVCLAARFSHVRLESPGKYSEWSLQIIGLPQDKLAGGDYDMIYGNDTAEAAIDSAWEAVLKVDKGRKGFRVIA